jgi:hypothetical protein
MVISFILVSFANAPALPPASEKAVSKTAVSVSPVS